MGRFEVGGLADLMLSMDELANLPDEVTDAMLDAGGAVFCAAIKDSASTMLAGPYDQGAVAGSIRKGRKRKTKNGKQLSIGFSGSQHGQPLARIAYVNEYGKKSQRARPFLRTAAETSADAIVAEEQKEYEGYLNSKNL